MSHPHHAPSTHEAFGPESGPVPDDHHDPLHDIDTLRTTIAVVGSLALVVVLVWLMTHVFNAMVRIERGRKIGDVQATELKNLRDEQRAELEGKNANRGTKTIRQAMEELAR